MSEVASSFVSALGWALLHFLWQGLAVGLAAALSLMLLRNARPQARYAVACAALALCAALPIFGLLHGLQTDVAAASPAAVSAATTPAAEPRAFVVPLESWRTVLQIRLPWIVSLWSLGAALLALRMAMGIAWVGRMRRKHAGTVDPSWQVRLDRLAGRFDLRRAIALRVATELDSPVAVGGWRPMVLVPASLIARMPPELLEALLAHELAHIKRCDYLVNLAQSAIEALLFYHPVVWWLSKRIRAERECIADELAAQALGEPRRLALALQRLDLIRSTDAFPQTFAPPFAPAAHGGNLMSRIQRLVRPDRHALSWKIALPILGLSAICLVAFAQGQAPMARPLAVAAPVPVASADPATPSAAPVPAAAPREKLSAARSAPASAPVPVATPVAASSARSTAVAAPVAVAAETRRIQRTSSTGDAYALVRAGREGMNVSGTTDDIRDADKARRSLQGDFLWFRRGDKRYVLQDPALLARVDQAWKPADALSDRMEALGGQMETHGKKMEALGRQMEALSAAGEPPRGEMERTSGRMEALSRQQQAISEKMQAIAADMADARDDAQRQALDEKMRALDAQMKPLSAQMQALGETMQGHAAKMQEAHQPMEALGQRMNEASKPMEALGKQMDALGKQMDAVSRQADQVVRSVIDEALAGGKAVPTSSLN